MPRVRRSKYGNEAVDNAQLASSLAQKAAQTDLLLKADKTYVDSEITKKASGAPKGVYATLTALQTALPGGSPDNQLVTADGKWYYWNGSAWTAGAVYQATSIADATVTPIKNSNSPILITAARVMPLISPEVAQTTGTSITVTFKTTHMLVNNNKEYMSCSADFSVTLADNDYLFVNWVSGVSNLNATNVFVATRTGHVPAYNKYLLFYNYFGRLYSPIAQYADHLTNVYNPKASKPNVISVAKSGGDYTTIQAAVDAITDEGTINVYPGVYEEAVTANSKKIHLVGIDKKSCILKNSIGLNEQPPLEMVKGTISNMTIYAEKPSGFVETDTTLNRNVYGLHVEYPTLVDNELEVYNCDIISDWSSAIGVGLRRNCEVRIRDSKLVSHALTTQISSTKTESYGAFYAHEAGSWATDTGDNQKLILDNCKMISDSETGLRIDSVNDVEGNKAYLTFYNNMVYSTSNGKTNVVKRTTPSGNGWAGSNITLTGDSYGNNIDIMNA
jgi:hypothetical protein